MAVRTIQSTFVMPESPEGAAQEWQHKYNEWLGEFKYFVSQQTAENVTYTRTYTPGFAIFFAIILFPIGLLFLLAKRQHTLALVFRPHPSGAVVTMSGSGSRDVIDALDGIAEDHIRLARTAGALPAGKVEPSAPPAHWPESSTIDDLERLQQLRDGGTLTQDEFEVQRQKVLDRAI